MLEAREKEKHSQMWGISDYRDAYSGSADENINQFMSLVSPRSGASIVDAGCGSGVAGIELEGRGFDVAYVDITAVALKNEVSAARFIEASLWSQWAPRYFDYGFCCGVLEQIPLQNSMLAAYRLVQACNVSFLKISNQQDQFGVLAGYQLSLTIQSFEWWRDNLASIGSLIEARDLCGESLFVIGRK